MEAAVDADLETALETGPSGLPRLLRWHARTWLVSDAPTPLADALAAFVTHPPMLRGWRFQGTDAHDGRSLVFDVAAVGAGWRVVKTWD